MIKAEVSARTNKLPKSIIIYTSSDILLIFKTSAQKDIKKLNLLVIYYLFLKKVLFLSSSVFFVVSFVCKKKN